MKKVFLRLFWAAFLSLACFGMTSYWYVQTAPEKSTASGKKPVAYVERTKDEILRRPLTRLLWQMVTDGDPLFTGEAIRTSPLGEVRIQFADSSRFIDLEPDSLIVISQTENKEISLDLRDGGLMVNQGLAASAGPNPEPSLNLTTAGTKVDLSQATASLSNINGKLDLQVLKGKARVDAKGQSQEVESGKSGAVDSDGVRFETTQLQILSPALDHPTSLDGENPQPVLFAWKGFPASSVVTLWTGKTRKDLKAVGHSSDDNIQLKLVPGKYFWKLVAHDSQSQKTIGESSLYRFELIPRFAPLLLSPARNEALHKAKPEQPVEFHWSRPTAAKSVTLEVASDELLKNKIISQSFDKEDSFSKDLPEGHYFVRLSAHYEDSAIALSGKIQGFQVNLKQLDPVKISWASSTETEKFLLPANGPLSVPLSWTSEQRDQVHGWRVKVSERAEDLHSKEAQVFETRDLSFKLNLKKPGRYVAMVEAMDEAKAVVASSPLKPLTIELPTLLTAPHFESASEELKADAQGRLNLQWQAVEGAKEYILTMTRPVDNQVQTKRLTKTSTALVNLLPGQFQIEIRAVDFYGREGERETRTVVVPDVSGLATPKVRKIKVK